MKIKLPIKFADRDIDEFIQKIHSNYELFSSDKYYFDFTDVEFIGNQELLIFSALLKSFVDSGIDFEVEFFKKGVSTNKINERVKKQIIQIWVVWKIWRILPNEDECKKYFGIDGKSVKRLQDELEYYPKQFEIYTRYGVTPFVSLKYINNYDETEIQKVISPIYKLNSVIEDLLRVNKCQHPFTSSSLSTIITEELYLNFLDHSLKSSFTNFKQYAFMSISFHSKIDEMKYNPADIQKRHAFNFQTECLQETKNFFYDKKTKKYFNTPYIQFSFLDFGLGIVKTLKEQYNILNPKSDIINYDSEVLRFAFNHDSSRHPIFSDENELEKFIPRGLFDALTIVRRYRGLLIVRSNYGKILFDFSINNDLENSFSYFGDNKLNFPGTFITLYIPAIEDISKLNVSSIKPEINFSAVKPDNKKYISINSISQKLKVGKDKLYSTLLSELKKEICDSPNYSLVFISFKGCELEKRIIKKTIYFLLSNYDINYQNNVVILNSLPGNLIDEIATEILMLSDAIKNYKLHPLPIIEIDRETGNLNVKWLGIYDDEDKHKLNDLLYEEYSIAKSDFKDPANVSGHLNEFDSYGNLISNFPSRNDIIKFYKIENDTLIFKQVEEILHKHNCIKKNNETSLYLCNGNYYQKEYVELNNLINSKKDCNTITQLLFDKLKVEIKDINQYKFIGITTISHKILKSLEDQNYISNNDYITLDNYHTFENDLNDEIIDSSKKYILICDVISTGYLTKRLNAKLTQLGTKIEHIAVITSCLHADFVTTKSFLTDFKDKIIFLNEYPIQKFERKQLTKEINSKNIIRINPHTNIPITLSINETKFDDSIIFHSSIEYYELTNEIIIKNKFLDSLKNDSIQVGFYKFNNVIHPYFFNTQLILKELGIELLAEIFNKINNLKLEKEKIQIFFPRKSGIGYFDFSKLRAVLNNHYIEEIEIERFGTPEGWRFPHNTDYLNSKIENNICLILDDGSCSGDSLIQMIDEISFYDAKEIVVLCIIGRVNDHKREFFSRLAKINVKDGKSIPISIYFACHWHIPTYYIDENPSTKEILWLNELISLQNIPQSIRNIASSIVNEITPKSSISFRDYKYLPKIEIDQSITIPKKELLLIREELGKVIGYRLYKESFIFFDCFLKKYEKKIESHDRYKEIELLCATFIYEPYLYDKIIGILPDVVEKIEEFVRVLIFSDLKIYNSLTYKWNKKDIVHLFFIAFKNEKLLQELDEDKFKKLIAFTEPKGSALNYVLYKLLNYFSINENQLKGKKFDTQLKELLFKLKTVNSPASKEIRKFYNFISTLPSRDDFNSQLRLLVDNFTKQKEPEFHIDKISFDHNVSHILALIRECIINIEAGTLLENEKIQTLRERWLEMLNFINPILTFSSSFKEYLLPYPYFRLISKVESGDNSLRKMVGFNESVIFMLNQIFIDIEKLKLVEKNIIRIQSDFKIDSDFHKLISHPESNLISLVQKLCKKIEELSKIIIITGIEIIDTKYNISIPEVYSEILIVKELTTNLNNHSKKESNSKVFISFTMKNDSIVEMKIVNTISDLAFNNSNGQGIKCLNLLSDSKLFGFKFKSKTDGSNFVQTLLFNIIKNGY